MGKKNDELTDFDKQLIAGMEEVVAHIKGEPNNGRTTIVEFADAKAIREGLGMSQSVFSRAYGIPLKTLQHWEHAGTAQTARLPPTFGRLRNFPIKSEKHNSVTRFRSPLKPSSGRSLKGEMRFPLGAICLHCRQPSVEQGVFR